jgi:hypothetical protein
MKNKITIGEKNPGFIGGIICRTADSLFLMGENGFFARRGWFKKNGTGGEIPGFLPLAGPKTRTPIS